MSDNATLNEFVPSTIVFHNSLANAPVFTITANGRLEKGAGLSDEEATQALFDCLAKSFPDIFAAWARAFVKEHGG